MTYRKWREKVRAKSEQKGIRFPTVSAKTYSRREKRLKASGLLDWERFWLVAHRLNTVGMRYMLEKRKARYLRAKEEKLTVQEYSKQIKDWYRNNRWTFKDGTLNPFSMFEWFRDKANADVTPTPKTKKKNRDFREYKKRSREKR